MIGSLLPNPQRSVVKEVADVGRRRGLAGARLVPEVHLEARQVLQLDGLAPLQPVRLQRVGSER